MINGASMLPEMLNCTDINMTVLERQRTRFKWQPDHHHFQQVQHQNQEDSSFFPEFNDVFQLPNHRHHHQQQDFQGGDLGEIVIRSVKPDPGYHDLVGFENFDMNFAISRTTSCPPTVLEAAAAAAEAAADLAKPRETVAAEKLINSGKKRKFDQKAQNNNNTKIVGEDETCRNKRSKTSAVEGESSNSKNSKENSAETSKVTDVQKPDYIHVRARRGQATDSHSLAERVRREKISERMKYLQDLVPGCNKITGKAGMLDEIINYVQSLQRQVEFLSMKLAAVNPRLDFNIDNLFAKEEFPPCPTNFPIIGDMSTNPAFFQLNPVQQQQLVACCGLEMGINPSDLGLRRTISAPVSVPESFIDSSCFNQIQPSSSTWNADLQNLYNVAFDQGRSAPFSTQQFTGTIETSEMKMEM